MRPTLLPSLLGAASLTSMAVVAAAPAALAQPETRHSFHLPSQALDLSLRAVALATGRAVAAPAELVKGVRAPALEGEFSAEEAVALLLAGTALRQRGTAEGIVIGDAPHSASQEGAGAAPDIVVVTGSRIRGAPIASPVIRLGREDMVRSGQSSLTDLVRSLPQGFGGGINVGIGLNAGENNGDYGGASSFNLRGIGPDATLTLLNGRRLAYNGARQGVDVSAIPLGAVDRVEIVPDGASALYGSDAVAGVVNVILRRAFEGLELQAEGARATEGGYARQRAGATAGASWQEGGVVLSYE